MCTFRWIVLICLPIALIAPACIQAAAEDPSLAPIAIALYFCPPKEPCPSTPTKKIKTALLTAMKQKSIRVTNESAATYTLRGYFVVKPDATGTSFAYVWDVTDKTNKGLVRFSGQELLAKRWAADAWSLIDEPVITTLAAKTAVSLAAWLKTQPPKKQN